MLFLCGCLAAGEYLASLTVDYAPVWPVWALAAMLVALFGYGLSVRGWHCLALFLTGLALYSQASVAETAAWRDNPWMRRREARMREAEVRANPLRRLARYDLSRRMSLGLAAEPEAKALACAILLGERGRLPQRTRRLFVESGTIHVFAISGLHVMAVADVLSVLILALLVPRRFAGCAALPVLWGYVCLIGFPASAVRAALMATVSFAAPVFWRRPQSLRAWELAFLAVHLTDPLMIANVGSALSFAVMLAIVVVGEMTSGLAKWKRSLAATLAAWAVGVPIAARVFGRVTPGGLLANLVLIAAARLTVYAGVAGAALSAVSDRVAAHVNNLCALGIKAMVLVADGVSRLPGSNFETGAWPLTTCIEWYVALLLACFLVRTAVARGRRI